MRAREQIDDRFVRSIQASITCEFKSGLISPANCAGQLSLVNARQISMTPQIDPAFGELWRALLEAEAIICNTLHLASWRSSIGRPPIELARPNDRARRLLSLHQ